MATVQRTHVGHPSKADIKLADRLLKTIGPVLEPLQEALRDHKGKKAETSLKAFYGYGFLNEMAGNRGTVTNMVAVAAGLDPQVRHRWGDTSPNQSYKRLITVNKRYAKLLKSGEYDVDQITTKILEAQLDASGIDYGKACAFDGTVIRSPAVTRFRKPTAADRARRVGKRKDNQVAWCKDPDAAYGHYPDKDGQESLAMGYEAHIACPVPTAQDKDMPIVASALSMQPNTTGTRTAIRDLLIQRQRYETVIFDAGYDFKADRTFQTFLNHGISPVFDPNKLLRKGQSSSHGKIIIDGDEFCPSTPQRLRDLAPIAPNMSTKERTKREAQYDERAKYMMARVSYDGTNVRSMCPALTGKVACPQRPESLNVWSSEMPDEISPPKTPPKCCVQQTTTTKVKILRRSRQGLHPYGTTEWGRIYRQRNRIESYNSAIRHNIGTLAERAWVCMFGREKTAVLFSFKLLATNTRNIETFLADRR